MEKDQIFKTSRGSIHNLPEVAQFKGKLLKKFGKQFQMETIFTQQAKMIPNCPEYMLHASQYAIPDNQCKVIYGENND